MSKKRASALSNTAKELAEIRTTVFWLARCANEEAEYKKKTADHFKTVADASLQVTREISLLENLLQEMSEELMDLASRK